MRLAACALFATLAPLAHAQESTSPAATPSTSPTTSATDTPAPSGGISSTTEASSRSWTLGPMFSFSVPHPLTLGLAGRLDPTWGGNINFGRFTYSPDDSAKIQDAEVQITHFEVVGEWHPWDGAFHVDAGLGRQTIAFDAVSRQKLGSSGGGTGSEKLSLKAEAEIVTTYLLAAVGWMGDFAGAMIGAGIGFQLPLSSSGSFDATLEDSATIDEAIKATQGYKDLESDTEKAAEKAGMLALPRIELLRIGYMF